MIVPSIMSVIADSLNIDDLYIKLSRNDNLIVDNAWLVGDNGSLFITRKPGANPIDSIADECSMMMISEDNVGNINIIAKSMDRMYEFGGEFSSINIINHSNPVMVEEWLPGKCAMCYIVEDVTYVSTKDSVYGNEEIGENKCSINSLVSSKLTSNKNLKYQNMKSALKNQSLILNITPNNDSSDFDIYLIDVIDMDDFSSVTDIRLKIIAKELGLKTPNKIVIKSENRLTKAIGDLIYRNPSIKGVILKNKFGERDKISIKGYDVSSYITPFSKKYISTAINCIMKEVYFGIDNELTTLLRKSVKEIELEAQSKYDSVRGIKLKRHFYHRIKDFPAPYLLIWMRENSVNNVSEALKNVDASKVIKHIMKIKKEEITKAVNILERRSDESKKS
jgi:hypothetical protein